ncbi:toll/interleukin-1 receptor domain-containing protein [Paractinoplanes toevensis]|uniref:TIR domain-containing protein n=1 Tax=Paractinoplanes toevensis TaxID=571911 RepID=A0A919W1B5_9ACTN|nr:toll/interleukin-1 receptor domain-containing protein [Actinoplanes toevensis]GIM88295.1 hypothetical protein Ato02nite_000880 [Actinoplanes toevensis]
MGFRAPSATEVYQYMFRLDRADRGLVDRFGWSILVVNDSSPVCREFLTRYCVDLCIRTADRVRFVFFSDLPSHHFGFGPEGGLGVLGAVLRRVDLDFERDPWRRLRPAALRPFAGIPDIDRQISSEVAHKTAMPGTGEALRFAQRLGIGRHVPCVVVFTDVGALTVQVLPFGELSADQIYQRIRGWIDDFYADNRAALARWESVEESIQRLVLQSHSSLVAVRNWRYDRLEAWRVLRGILTAEKILDSDPEEGLRRLRVLAGDYHIPWAIRSRLDRLTDELANFDRHARTAAELRKKADALARRSTPDQIRSRLRDLQWNADTGTRALADEALALGEPPRPEAPRMQLLGWWRTTAASALSRNRFRRHRLTWDPEEPTTAFAGVRHRDRLRAEYAAFRDTVGRCHLDDDPDACARQIFTALAELHRIPGDDATWLAATAGHRESLANDLRELQRTAPRWLAGLEIRECLPPGDEPDPEAFLASAPRLLAAVAARRGPALEPYTEAHLRYRDRVCESLRAEADRQSAVATGRAAAVEALRPTLESIHTELVAAARSQALAGTVPAEVNGPDLAAVPRLAEALDEYDAAVAEIRFPHQRDGLIPVRTTLSPVDAAGIDAPRRRGSPDERLAGAVATTREARALLPATRTDVQRWRSAARLAAALSTIVEPARLAELLPDDDGPAPIARLNPAEVRALRKVDLTEPGLPAPAGPAGFDVFMAHNSADKPAVRALGRRLRARGLNPWIDIEQIPPGRWFSDVIQSAVLTAGAAAVCIGPAGVGRWQALEIRTFLEQCVNRGVPVIPVLLPGADRVPEDLVFLRNLHHVRFAAGLDEKAALDQLVWGITGHR